MNLIIDVGNTLVKFAVFQSNHLHYSKSVLHTEFNEQYTILKQKYPKLTAAIVASVGNLNKTQLKKIKDELQVLELNSKTKLPFKNNYKTPKTLGVDRIALASACTAQFFKKNVLVIDAGTCITYDFVREDNTYLGGAISPGLRMRYKALHKQTAKLPLLDTKTPKDFIGNSTETSIHSGVVNGISREIDGVINQYEEKYPDLTVILTGGDTKILSNQLKNGIFANSNFLLEGLNFILDYNKS